MHSHIFRLVSCGWLVFFLCGNRSVTRSRCRSSRVFCSLPPAPTGPPPTPLCRSVPVNQWIKHTSRTLLPLDCSVLWCRSLFNPTMDSSGRWSFPPPSSRRGHCWGFSPEQRSSNESSGKGRDGQSSQRADTGGSCLSVIAAAPVVVVRDFARQ